MAIPPECSPPFTAYGGGATSGESAVWRSCVGDPPGGATVISFLDFADADQCHNPVLSPDGRKILFEVLSPSNDFEIWVVNATPGSTPVKLIGVVDEHYYHPSWGPDSNTFVYVKGTENHTGGVGVTFTIFKDTLSAVGSPDTLTTLTPAAFGCYLTRPMVSPDGTRVSYFHSDGTTATFRCMDADGSNDTLLDTVTGYLFNDPPQSSWAYTQNKVVYSDGAGSRKVYVISEDGTGRTQLNANGDAAGIKADVSHLAWAEDDSFVIISADLALGDGIQPVRAEVDGSDTTLLPLGAGWGPANRDSFRTCLVYDSRIWWIRYTNSELQSRIQSCLLNGSDPRNDFDNTAGPGDLVGDFSGGDGWYYI